MHESRTGMVSSWRKNVEGTQKIEMLIILYFNL